MNGMLDVIAQHPVRHFDAGEAVLHQGERSGTLLVLIAGSVEVLRDDVCVATSAQPGVVFGEMSALLGGAHTATVRARSRTSFAVIGNPREFLETSPRAGLLIAELLARRLDALNQYLVNVKHQYEGHDHLGMVDEVLEALMHRQPRPATAAAMATATPAPAR